MPESQIKYISQKEIDKTKWDNCINNAPNGIIYAFSYYLDAMAKHWDALVLGDYEAVMPLTWNKKYGFYYLYQPAFTASLGVFGKNIDEQVAQSFLSSIPQKFRLIEISLNAGNYFGESLKNSYPRVNYTLDLHKDYQTLYSSYRDNHKRNIAKAFQLGSTVNREIPVDEVTRLNEEQLRHISGTKPEDYTNFKKLFEQLLSKQQASVYGILGPDNNILSSAVFFFSHNRAYYILVGNHPDGKTIGASHALIDAFIKDYSGKDLILDFEGSDMRNLAFFYSGFGAKEELYPFLKINKLPFYIKWLKN